MIPIEKIAASGMTIQGMNETQYHKSMKYIRRIASGREVRGKKVVYHVEDVHGGGDIITYPSERKMELTDGVSIDVIGSIREIFKFWGNR